MPLHQNPMTKATLAATALATISNVLAQLLEAHNAAHSTTTTPTNAPIFSLDVLQIIRFALVVALTTPPNYLWQILLERTFPAYGPCPEDSAAAAAAAGAYRDLDDGALPLGKRGSDQRRTRKRTASNASSSDIDLEKQTSSIPLSFLPPPTSSSSSPSSPASTSTSSTSSSTTTTTTTTPYPSHSRTAKPVLNWRNTFAKWFIDCITLGALFNTVAFFLLMGLLKGQGWSQIASTVAEQTMPLILAGYRVWPLASAISFTVVPVEKRVVFMNFVGLVWGVYMSFIAARV